MDRLSKWYAFLYLVPVLMLAAPVAAAPPQGSPTPDVLPMPSDFPPADQQVWRLERKGLLAKLAARELARAPDAPETMNLLYQAGRLDDGIAVFGRIVHGNPWSLERALQLAPALVLSASTNVASGRLDRLRELVAEAAPRITGLPREDAARAARALLTLESNLGVFQGGTWPERLRAFTTEWAGTEAAVLTEVDVILAGDLKPGMLDALDTFARRHPGTAAAARALFERGSHLAHNATALRMERPGSDPLKRFLAVHEIVRELEIGRYPQCEWVSRAPDLLTGFFSYKPAYADGTVARMLAAYEDIVRSSLERDDQDLQSQLEHAVSHTMLELYEASGDAVTGGEDFLSRLERGATNPAAVKYTRALFYLRLASERFPSIERAAVRAKARAELEALHQRGAGLYQRKALATLAVLEGSEGHHAVAARLLTKYLANYPDSPWAWVAALRLGKAYEATDSWAQALTAYLDAASKHSWPAPARALAYAYAGGVDEARGAFADALANHQRALAAWDDDFGTIYSLYLTRPGRADEPFAIVKDDSAIGRDAVSARVSALERALAAPGGSVLETARWHFARGDMDPAVATLERFFQLHPDSPIAADARVLSHRARVARALDRRDRAELERLEQEPYDFWISAARMARAAMLAREGASAEARALMMKALTDWQEHSAALMPASPMTDLERDVIGLRNLAFRPRGDGLFEGSRWELNSLSPGPSPFFIVRPDLTVKLAGGDTTEVSVHRPIPEFRNVLFMNAEQLAFFDSLLTKIGGTERRQPGSIMEIPNQPVGGSRELLTFLQKFFPARPGHWGGWMFETFPVVNFIEFMDPGRTRAGVAVTIGYEGATLVFEKRDGAWVYKEMVNRWIT